MYRHPECTIPCIPNVPSLRMYQSLYFKCTVTQNVPIPVFQMYRHSECTNPCISNVPSLCMYQSLYFKYTITHKVLVFLYRYLITRTKKIRRLLKWRRQKYVSLHVLSGRFDDVCRFVQTRDDVRNLILSFSVCSALKPCLLFLMIWSVTGRLFFIK